MTTEPTNLKQIIPQILICQTSTSTINQSEAPLRVAEHGKSNVLNSGEIEGPYTYKWRVKYDNGPWINVPQGNDWFTVNLYPGAWVCAFIEVTIEDPTGIYIATAAHTICSCEDMGEGSDREIKVLAAANNNKFIFYPNPTHSDGILRSTTSQNTNIQVRLVDILGVTRQDYLIKDTHSANQWPIGLKGIEAGTYFLHLTGAGINETIKIVKSN